MESIAEVLKESVIAGIIELMVLSCCETDQDKFIVEKEMFERICELMRVYGMERYNYMKSYKKIITERGVSRYWSEDTDEPILVGIKWKDNYDTFFQDQKLIGNELTLASDRVRGKIHGLDQTEGRDRREEQTK